MVRWANPKLARRRSSLPDFYEIRRIYWIIVCTIFKFWWSKYLPTITLKFCWTIVNHVQNLFQLTKETKIDFDAGEYHVIDTKYYMRSIYFYEVDEDEVVDKVLHVKQVFEIHFKNNGKFHANLFYVPLFGIFASTVQFWWPIQIAIFFTGSMWMILISFWTFNYSRLILNCIAFIILSVMHILLLNYGPHEYVPSLGISLRLAIYNHFGECIFFASFWIVYYYCIALVAALIGIFMYITNCCIKEYCKNVRIMPTVFTISWVRLILGLDLSWPVSWFDPSNHNTHIYELLYFPDKHFWRAESFR